MSSHGGRPEALALLTQCFKVEGVSMYLWLLRFSEPPFRTGIDGHCVLRQYWRLDGLPTWNRQAHSPCTVDPRDETCNTDVEVEAL